jgi:von Willebrand factor type A domain/SdrD B-like domain
VRKLTILISLFLLLLPLGAQAQDFSYCSVDVELLIDSSASISPENFQRIKDFVGGIAANLPLGGDNVRIGVIQFAGEAQPVIGLTTNAGAISGAVSGLSLLGGASNFVNALQAGQAALEANSRPYVTRALVLITDGFSVIDPQRTASAIRQQQTAILAVGIGGGLAARELYNIASPLYYANTVYLTRFDTLGYTVGGLRDGLCNTPGVVGGTISANLHTVRGWGKTYAPEGVTVNLYDTNQNLIRSTVTDAYGHYRFYVGPGTYNLVVVLPEKASFMPTFDGRIGPVRVSVGRRYTSAYTSIRVDQ